MPFVVFDKEINPQLKKQLHLVLYSAPCSVMLLCLFSKNIGLMLSSRRQMICGLLETRIFCSGNNCRAWSYRTGYGNEVTAGRGYSTYSDGECASHVSPPFEK